MAEAKKPATKAAKKDKAFQIKVVFQGSVRVHSARSWETRMCSGWSRQAKC